jgi:hypothetical protein
MEIDVRKKWIWEDFRSFVDRRMKGKPWETEMDQIKWCKEDKETPQENQRIIIEPLETPRDIEKWEKWNDSCLNTWYEYHACEMLPWRGMWKDPMVPDGEGEKSRLTERRITRL